MVEWVVIAIISILAGLLLPALVKVREAARTAVCSSNMKQTYLVLEMYADNTGYYPLDEYEWYAGMPMFWTWVGILMDGQYLGRFEDAADALRVAHVLHCPSQNPKVIRFEDLMWPRVKVDYALDINVNHYQYVKPRSIKRPSKLFFVGETLATKQYYGWSPGYPYFSRSLSDPRHMGRMNILYFDGHQIPHHEEWYTNAWEWKKLPWYNATVSKAGYE